MNIDRQKLIIGGATLTAIILVALGIRYFLKKKKTNQLPTAKDESQKPDVVKDTSDSEEANTTHDEDSFAGEEKKDSGVFPLQVGSQGKEVEQLQLWLLKNHGIQTNLSGIFDHPTENALMRTLERQEISESEYKKYRLSDFKTFKN
ncbi:hypothetical protein BKI52_33130 [marine bacterium AO1-C]|nr:hypothetical protein BKI52_33130 [marine bacterium AO1-C]